MAQGAAYDQARKVLVGAYDLHIHAAPDGYGRNVDYIEAAEDAAALGMKAIVFKDHHFPTVGLAHLTNKLVPEVESIGSITMANSIGGFNAEAVLQASKRGARVLFFPTLDSPRFLHATFKSKHLDHVRRLKDEPVEPLRAIKDGKVRPEVEDVLAVVRDKKLLLGLAYMTRDEAVPIIKKAQEMGIRRIMFSHPQSILGLPLNHQIELRDMGVYLVFNQLNCYPDHGDLQIDALSEMIRQAGDMAVLASSGGQASLPPPAELMRQGVAALLENGMDEERLRRMLVDNPAYLLDD